MGILSELPPCWFIGRLNCISGYGEAARHQMLALAEHGLNIYGWHCATRTPVKETDTAFSKDTAACIRMAAPVDVEPTWAVVHMCPDNAAPFRKFLPKKQALSFVWETSHLPAYWIPMINTYTQVWVPTAWNKEICVSSGVTVPVHVVPFAFRPDYFPERARLPAPPWTDDKVFTFSSVFAWDERKNPEGLIRAYMHAFTSADPVQLVIKSYGGVPGSGSIQEKVGHIIAGAQHPNPPRVVVVNENLTREQMLALVAHSDVYVCASRGEGWGLPVTEAAMYGVPAIVADNTALSEQGLGFPVDCVEEPVWGMAGPNYTWPQVWSTPRTVGLARAMRDFFESPAARQGQALIATERLTSEYTTERAAEQAKRAVTALFSD